MDEIDSGAAAEVTPVAGTSAIPRLDPAVGAALVGLYVAGFLVSLDRAVFAPLLPALARDFGQTIGAVGLAVSAYTIPYGLFQLAYGPLGDRHGKLVVVRWAFLVFSFGTGLCGVALSLGMLDLLRAVTGACAAATIPMALAYIGDVVPYDRRQATITNLMGATSAGNAMSAAVGGVIGELVSWRALFLLYGACGLIVSAALYRMVRGAPTSARRAVSGGAALQYRDVLRHRQARLLYGLVILEGAFVNGGFTYLGAYLSDRFGISYLAIGVILAGYGAGTLATSRIVRHALRRIGENGLILAGGLLLGGGFLSLKVLPWWPAFVLPMLGMGAGFALFHSTLQVRATELIPALRGTAVALFAFFLFLGSGAGTAILGWVATTYGYTPLLLASGLGMLAVTALARAVW